MSKSLTYENIEHNIQTYLEARELFPIIIDYENGLVNRTTLGRFGLSNFGDFYNFKKRQEQLGFSLVDEISYRKLKPLIVNQTVTGRFKSYIKNRTQKQFIEILSDYNKFDRLLNGRILYKGKRVTRRDSKKLEGLKYCIIPILNYIISNKVEVDKWILTNSTITSDTRWYHQKLLEIKNVPKKEMELTKDMINTFIDVIDESEVDYRKLNIDYITDTLISKLKNLMEIPNGTSIKSKVNLIGRYSTQALTKDKSYIVQGCHITQGKLRVMIKNDSDSLEYYDYSNFEDMALKREQLLNQLFGE